MNRLQCIQPLLPFQLLHSSCSSLSLRKRSRPISQKKMTSFMCLATKVSTNCKISLESVPFLVIIRKGVRPAQEKLITFVPFTTINILEQNQGCFSLPELEKDHLSSQVSYLGKRHQNTPIGILYQSDTALATILLF